MDNDQSTVSNLADPILLNKVDHLFACDAGAHIALPQLVAADQSSGKSASLKGLLNCLSRGTVASAQDLLRRSYSTGPRKPTFPCLSFLPKTQVQSTLRWFMWSKADLKSSDAKSFAEIIIEVHDLMGLSGQHAAYGGGNFFEDVLRLEICGPEQEQLSIVDVPGIFRKTTEGVTTKADSEMVRFMVQHYMENPRSVMLTVIPANVDIVTQEILTMAEEVDDGHRTLGVLTKLDLVDRGADTSVMELIQGKRYKLNLSWCLVRNLGQQQLQDSSANGTAIERDFFRNRMPWNTLDKDRVGVDALRVRLREILTSKIRREFPKVRSEIHKRLVASRQTLDELEAKRETTAEQCRYLLDISMQFQEMISSALSANHVGAQLV